MNPDSLRNVGRCKVQGVGCTGFRMLSEIFQKQHGSSCNFNNDRSSLKQVNKMTAVGFEPTQLALVELESTPLDYSGKLSLLLPLGLLVF